jgi:hypothetical protein
MSLESTISVKIAYYIFYEAHIFYLQFFI